MQYLGFRAGDIVRILNGVRVESAARFRDLATSGAGGWQIVPRRGNQTIRPFING